MNRHKIISLILTVIMVVAVTSSAAFADGAEGDPRFTFDNGLSIAIPSEIGPVIWTGMAEDDPSLDDLGIVKENVESTYDETGLMLQGSSAEPRGNDCFFVMVFETDAPEELTDTVLNSNYAEKISMPFEPCFSETQQFGYGTTEINGIPLYKIFSQVSGEMTLRFYQYSLITEDGSMYQIHILMIAGGSEPLSDDNPDCAYLDELACSVINSLTLSDDLSAKVVDPGTDAFKMSSGDYSAAASVESGEPAPATAVAAASETSKTKADPIPAFYKAFSSFEFPTYIILIALGLLLLLGAKVSKRREWHEEPLGLDTSKAVQGFAAVAIIIHHLAQELVEDAGALEFFSELGVLFVGIFFFFSGYGLYTSLKTKENYLKGFLRKRLVTVLIPFYTCILTFVAAACICGKKFHPIELLYVLSGWSLINGHMWYIVEIVILYLVFFLVYRLIKNRTAATVVMTVFVIAMIVGSLLLGHGDDFSCSYWFQGEWWYNSTFLFILGIIFSKHAEGIRNIARKGYWILLPVFAALTVLLGLQTKYALTKFSYWSEQPGVDPAYGDKFHCLAIQLPWIIVFVCFLLLVMMKVRFGNPVLKFLGTISLELYLIHNLFLTGLRNGTMMKITSNSMYIVLTVLLAAALAAVLSGFDKYVISLINGKKAKADVTEEPGLKSGRKQIHSIDVMRIVMAFSVVTIHWPFDGKAGEVFITYGKTAAPFFLVIAGYFLFREDGKEMTKRLLKQGKRMLIFYLAANVFYGVAYAVDEWITNGDLNGLRQYFTAKSMSDFLLYNLSPFSEHLWFLGSLLYAIVIMLILNKLKILKYVMFAAPALVAAYCILMHMGVGEPYQLRNALFVGLGYTMMGMLIRRFEKKILDHKFSAPVLWILFVICCTTAIFELNGYKQGIAVPFASCEILLYVIVLLCLKYPDFGKGTFAEKLGHECSLTVYIMHMFTLMLFLATGNENFFGRYGAVFIFAVTAAGAYLYKNIKNAVISTRE
ncbi:MAG: acyltransferase [Clostridiales bacterium]|nr:acyltransferase [Clostridiales bacterium]